jgi:hypothetical protein
MLSIANKYQNFRRQFMTGCYIVASQRATFVEFTFRWFIEPPRPDCKILFCRKTTKFHVPRSPPNSGRQQLALMRINEIGLAN